MGRFIKLAAPEEPVEEDPLAGMANLFDVSIVFIVGLMIAMFSVYNMGEVMNGDSEVTVVTTNDKGEQEIVVKRGPEIKAYKLTAQTGTGDGTRLGTAYKLANGQVIYVPDADSAGVEADASPSPPTS